MAKIYYVEDDESIAYIIKKTIENAGLEALGFQTAKAFFETYETEKPNMILLDVMLPDSSGLEILKTIRKEDSSIPIMMISALQSEMDKVLAFDLGADDYLTKPFGILELTSRIQARLRLQKEDKTLTIDNIVINENKRIVLIDNIDINATKKEYDILKLLIENTGNVISKETFFENIWDTNFIGESRTLDMHIKSLRDKIKTFNGKAEIKTIRGIGYKIEWEKRCLKIILSSLLVPF